SGRERGDIVGVHDALGGAEDYRLGEQPPAEHEHTGQARVAAQQAPARADLQLARRLLLLALVESEHRQRGQQADRRERQDPAGLVAEADAEQAKRPGWASEGDRVDVSTLQVRGGEDGFLDRLQTMFALALVIYARLLGRGHVGARLAVRLPGTSGLAFDSPE